MFISFIELENVDFHGFPFDLDRWNGGNFWQFPGQGVAGNNGATRHFSGDVRESGSQVDPVPDDGILEAQFRGSKNSCENLAGNDSHAEASGKRHFRGFPGKPHLLSGSKRCCPGPGQITIGRSMENRKNLIADEFVDFPPLIPD